jgi:SAM-dependent methyltransferase
MLDRARQWVAEANLSDRIVLVREDVHAMRLPADYADIVLSRSTIHHWSNPRAAFAEIYRVLKPGGVALIHDIRRDAPREALEEFNRIRERAELSPSFIEEKFTADELEEFLREAGLDAVASVRSGSTGLAALGMEVQISKPA